MTGTIPAKADKKSARQGVKSIVQVENASSLLTFGRKNGFLGARQKTI
ncbi:MAG: hypothetical protein KGQ41_00465 [Alphaproteobacteria bacterium]|nr:hypothetical protein [Alphaproteobacteria bacterium]